MRIGFEINDSGFENIDLKDPEEGNPGIGGTQFEFILLISSLLKYTCDYEIFVYHYSLNKYPESIHDCIVESERDILKHAQQDNIDVLVYKTDKDEVWYELIEKYGVKCIAWAHTYLKYQELKAIENSKNTVRLICVGKEQYDTHIDDDIIAKTSYIYNMVDCSKLQIRNPLFKKEVTYIGSLIREKGFHVLAQAWKDVLREIPDAKLNVIGSGKLYNRNSQLGEYGIADKEYEKDFIPYLINNDGELLPSVKFLGILGTEKQEILKNTAVGVVNPTAVSETFCISAVEFEGQGIPVCSCKKNGLLDTVQNKKTGLLSKSAKSLAKNIIELLNDNKKNVEYGRNGIEYVKKFSPSMIVKKWDDCFREIISGEKVRYIPVTGNYLNNGKCIRIIDRWIRFTLGIKCFPSVNTMLFETKKLYHKLKGVQ